MTTKDLKEVSTNDLIDEIIERGKQMSTTQIYPFLKKCYSCIVSKIWKAQVIATILKEEGFEDSDENIRKVIEAGVVHRIIECMDDERHTIRCAVYEAEDLSKKA